MAILSPIIIVPEQEGIDSTLQILIKPNSETVTVLELYPYDWGTDGGEFVPSQMVNSLFEASARADELAAALKDAELTKLGAYDTCKCIIHLHHLLDGEPVICNSLATALRVAKTIADHT